MNFPVLTAVITDGSSTTIQGTYSAASNGEYVLQFFSNAACDSSGNGEGQTYLGEQRVTTDASGNSTINVALPVEVTPGQAVTATATNDFDADFLNTSEFSACRTAESVGGTPTPSPAPTASVTPTPSPSASPSPTAPASPS